MEELLHSIDDLYSSRVSQKSEILSNIFIKLDSFEDADYRDQIKIQLQLMVLVHRLKYTP